MRAAISEPLLKGEPQTSRYPFRPRALIGVPPKDLCAATDDHLLLNVCLPKLRHCSSIAVLGDPTDSNLLAHQDFQMVSSRSGWYWLSALPAKFRVSMHVSNPLTRDGYAGIAVVRRRSQRMQEQQATSLMAVSVTDEWITSTRTPGSFIRG